MGSASRSDMGAIFCRCYDPFYLQLPMKVLVANGKTRDAARDLVKEFRLARTNARQALLDRDAASFKMYASQMRSFLELEFWDHRGNVTRLISLLSQDEQSNPYQLSAIEDIAVTQWIAKILREKGKLN